MTPKTMDQVFFGYCLAPKKVFFGYLLPKKGFLVARKETTYKHHLDLCHVSHKTTTQIMIYKKKNGQKSHAQNKYFYETLDLSTRVSNSSRKLLAPSTILVECIWTFSK